MANTYCYIFSYSVYVAPGETPVTIDTTAYTSAYTFLIQPEEVEAWSYTNSAVHIKPYNYKTITVNQKVWADNFVETKLDAAEAVVDNTPGQE
jgi:hypothetical protein